MDHRVVLVVKKRGIGTLLAVLLDGVRIEASQLTVDRVSQMSVAGGSHLTDITTLVQGHLSLALRDVLAIEETFSQALASGLREMTGDLLLKRLFHLFLLQVALANLLSKDDEFLIVDLDWRLYGYDRLVVQSKCRVFWSGLDVHLADKGGRDVLVTVLDANG